MGNKMDSLKCTSPKTYNRITLGKIFSPKQNNSIQCNSVIGIDNLPHKVYLFLSV